MFMGRLIENQQFAQQNRSERITGYKDQYTNRSNSIKPFQAGYILRWITSARCWGLRRQA